MSEERGFQPPAGAKPPSPTEGEPLKTRKMSGCTKLLLGCGCGCVSIFILATIAGVWIIWWALEEKPIIAAEICIDDTAISVVSLRLDRNSPLTKAIIRDLAARMETEDPEGVKEMKKAVEPAHLMDRALPIQLTVVSREGVVAESEKENICVVLSYARLSNAVNWLWEKCAEGVKADSPGDVIEHEGGFVMTVEVVNRERKDGGTTAEIRPGSGDEGSPYMSCLGNNLIVSGDGERVKMMRSRLKAGTADFGGNTGMKDMFSRLAADRDAFGIVLNKDGVLDREFAFLQERGSTVDFTAVEGMCWDAKAVGEDKIEGTARFKAKTAEVAKRLAEAFERTKADIVQSVADDGMQLTLSPAAEGDVAVIQFTLEGFRDELVKSFFDKK
ncbi:MAG: hypothetical protein RDV41_02290 [Planctomycetota bacterium]|nr:hypothetical protein [Planctomycetota bacterium]